MRFFMQGTIVFEAEDLEDAMMVLSQLMLSELTPAAEKVKPETLPGTSWEVKPIGRVEHHPHQQEPPWKSGST